MEGMIPLDIPLLNLEEYNNTPPVNEGGYPILPFKQLYKKSYLSLSSKLKHEYKLPVYKNDTFNNIELSSKREGEKLFEFLRKKLNNLHRVFGRMKEYRVVGNDAQGQSVFLCRFINKKGTDLPNYLKAFNKKELLDDFKVEINLQSYAVYSTIYEKTAW